MARTLSLLVAVLLMSCASGYTPPVSDSRGPASAPSVAVDSSWTKQQRSDTYASSDGRMFSVYTNATVGGAMFFEIVSNDRMDMHAFADKACENLTEDRGIACGKTTATYAEDSRGTVNLVATEFPFSGAEQNRHGTVVVRQMLGNKTRYMVCTGVWSLYGQDEDRAAQAERSTQRLRDLCKAQSGG